MNTLDYSKDITIKATSGGIVDCYWSIISSDTSSRFDASGSGESESSNSSDGSSGNTESTILNGNSYEISNKEADAVFRKFMDDVGYIASDEMWESALLIQYDLFSSRYAEWYEEYVDGGTKDEFLEMSLFDRFVWAETYLRFAWAVNTGDVSTYFGSEENFKSHITSNVTNMMENADDYETVENAYLTLAQWQYEYVQETGVPFNFINNRSYLEEVGEAPETESEISSDEQELEEAANELLEDSDEETKNSVWDDTLNMLSKNLLTICIAIILCVAVAIVVWKKKKLNISDDKDSDSSIDSTHKD